MATVSSSTAKPRLHPRLTLAIVCVAGGLLPASLTGSSIALPDIAGSLDADLVSLQWVINAYNLAFASLMLATGALGDLIGRRRMFAGGLALFVLCSLGSGLAQSVLVLDLMRGAAGAGAAAVLTAGTAVLAETFEGRARAKAFGMLGSSFGVGLALGPSLSGVLVSGSGWRAVFLAHALIGGVVLLCVRSLHESRDPDATGVDWPGTATFTAALSALTLGIVEGPQIGWSDPRVLGLFGAFAVLIYAFVAVERRRERPMFELSLFTESRFVAVCLMPVLLAFGFVCLLVFLPSYFIGVGGLSAREAGARMLVLTVPVLVFPVVAGMLAHRVPMRTLLAGSLVLVAVGAAWLTTLTPDTTIAGLIGPLALIGTGVGISFGLLDGAAVSSVLPARAGMAAGMFNTMRLASEALAIAAMGSVLVSLTASHVANGASRFGAGIDTQEVANRAAQGDLAGAAAGAPAQAREAFAAFVSQGYTDALHTVLWILAAVCAVGAPAIALLLSTRDTPAARSSSARAPTEPRLATTMKAT